jgi:hypothetical protein
MMFILWFDRRYSEATRLGSILRRPNTGMPPE